MLLLLQAVAPGGFAAAACRHPGGDRTVAQHTRVDVHGFGSSGPRLASGARLQDSYIHGFVCAPPDHSAGTTANDGGSNITCSRSHEMKFWAIPESS